jgi:hypothetical protein
MTYTQPQYGKEEYQQAVNDWSKAYGTYSSLLEQPKQALKSSVDYYSPGGGYGEGQRTEAKETVQAGVNKDLSTMVSTGMSSQAGSKGLQTLANTQLGKMYKNIEDTRAELLTQSITPYAQLMESISTMMNARPTYNEYVKTPVDNTSDILQAQQQSIARNTARDTEFWS